MSKLAIVFSFVLFVTCSLVSADTTLSVYHKRGGDYLKRGEITGIPHAPKYSPLEHSEGDLVQGLYQVKIKNEDTGHITLSSVPSCHLKASNFSEIFRVHLDNKQNVYHIDYYADTFECQPITEHGQTQPFNSNIEIIKASLGPKPVLGQVNGKSKPPVGKKSPQQQKHDAGNTNDEGHEQEEEEKSFFQKYWYIILAGALMFLSNTMAPPEPAQPARGSGSGSGNQPPARR